MGNVYTNYFEGTRISDGWAEHLARGSAGGIDYAVGVGTPIKAPTDGRIANTPNNGSGGHTVTLYHANGYRTQFMHLSRFVGEGNVSQGSVIGYTGGAAGSDGAGSSTGPHCHTHLITSGGTRVNPLNYVGQDFGGSVSGGSSGGWEYTQPADKGVATEIQQRLAQLGVYSGDIDGIFGPLTAKGIQTVIKNAGLYSGDVDGVPGPLTCAGIQNYGHKNGNYAPPGVMDSILGPLSWAGFLQTLREDMGASAAAEAAKAKAVADAKAVEEAKAKAAAEAKAKAELAAKAAADSAKAKAEADAKAKVEQAKATEVKVAEVKKEEFVPVEIPVVVTNSANDIGVIISKASTRKKVYAGYVAVSFLITNTVVAYSSIEAPIPVWLKIALAVVGNSAVAFGGLAIANTGNKTNG